MRKIYFLKIKGCKPSLPGPPNKSMKLQISITLPLQVIITKASRGLRHSDVDTFHFLGNRKLLASQTKYFGFIGGAFFCLTSATQT